MKRIATLLILFPLLLTFSCKTTVKEQEPAFNISLTQAETDAGVMTPEILWKFGRLGNIGLSPDGKSLFYTTTYYDLPTEATKTNIYMIPSEGGKPRALTTGGGTSPAWINGGQKIAYARQGKLVTMNADGTGKAEIEGMVDFESFAVSPNGKKIYFTRRVTLDQTRYEKYNLPKANMRIIDDLMFRHWNYWSDYSYSHIFVADFDGKSVSAEKDIMEGQRFESPLAPDFDGSEISWSPDGKYIAYTCKMLNGKEDAISTNSDIFLYELETGEVRNISEPNKGYDRYPVFSPDGSELAWVSQEEDGYESDLDRLFVYNFATGTTKWVSEGWDFCVGNIVWKEDGSKIYFTSPYLGTVQIFDIDPASSEIKQVSSGQYDFGPVELNGNTIISGIQSMAMAMEVARIDAVTGKMQIITSVNKSIYDNIKMGRSEERYTKTKDGKDLQMWVIYPPDFDPSKSYPTLLYCKGGPQGPLSQSWSYRWNYQMMAANGYIVVAPNRRGVTGFGSEWREEISGDYGGKNMQDYLDAIDYMAEEPFVDKDRLGAVGASYGGYSVFYLAGIHEGRFKAFISHCGMFDIDSWYGSTEELWFPNKDIGGPYWEEPKPKGYEFSPHLNVDKWDTPILIITGEHDYRIPYTQSMEAFTAAQLRGIPSRLLFFHDETHFVSHPQDAVIWQKEFFNWLDTYLK